MRHRYVIVSSDALADGNSSSGGGGKTAAASHAAGGRTARTKTVKRSLNPVWNETVQLNVDDASQPLRLRVMDADVIGSDDFLGDAAIELCDLESGQPTTATLTLRNARTGELDVEVVWLPLVA